MIKELLKRTEVLAEAVDEWLQDRDGGLSSAVRKTVDQNLFPEHDIRFALECIRQSVDQQKLENWVRNVIDLDSDAKLKRARRVLCLHAGNLPLVGFQDIVAVFLSGNQYSGKLSRKDPWLPESLLNVLQKKSGQTGMKWSVMPKALITPGESADAVLFSGSEKSVPEVKTLLGKLGILNAQTRFLIRTAHASAAWFDPEKDKLPELAEAVLRYQGRGCRSVASVFTTADAPALLKSFEPHVQSFLSANTPETKKKPLLEFRAAYNTAVGKKHIRAGNLIIECGDPDMTTDGVVTITTANPEKLQQFRDKAGSHLQSVYAREGSGIPESEPLAQAQRPPVDWKPDGIDPLAFLIALRR